MQIKNNDDLLYIENRLHSLFYNWQKILAGMLIGPNTFVFTDIYLIKKQF
jgi:hypothetical protein